MGTGVKLEMPGVEFTNQIVTVTPLPGSSKDDKDSPSRTQAEGVIGLSVFQNFVMTFDYERKIVTLTNPGQYKPEAGGHILPIALGPTNVPEASIEVEILPGERIPMSVVVDTGPAFSAWGQFKGNLGRASALRIGDFTLHNVLTTFFRMGDPGVPPCGHNGLLGNEALGRFKITFDYAPQRMILVSVGCPL